MDEAERRLVERLKRRDEAAFNELVHRYQGRVYRMLRAMLSNPAEAEEVAQDVFVTVFKSIDGFRGESQLSTWLYRVTANHGKNRIKYLARRARDAHRPLTEQHETGSLAGRDARPDRPDQTLEGRRAEAHVRDALMDLDEEQRTLVVLRDLEGMTYDEMVQVTGLPIGTVKSRLHRARMTLLAGFRRRTGESK